MGIQGIKKGDFIDRKYEVLDVLGEGGFGIVYQVSSIVSKRVYALKTYRDEYLQTTQVRERFKREAKVWVDLYKHPYIVRAYSVINLNSRFFILMEYIEPDEFGMNSLSNYLRQQPPHFIQSIRWAIQFCFGMEYAYTKGISAHRDIKPSNIMIDKNKIVKIADFGLAGVIQTMALSKKANTTEKKDAYQSWQTEIGTSIGTPEYMAPEQFDDLTACDERSDIYSFGIVLYQMASGGKLPFYAERPDHRWAVLKHLHQNQMVPKLNLPIFPIIMRCVEKEPINRYQAFRELNMELQPILRDFTKEVIEKPEQEMIEKSEARRIGLNLMKLDHYEEADNYVNLALTSDSSDSRALMLKGIVLSHLSKHAEAASYFDKALSLDPLNSDAWKNKGTLLRDIGNYDEAINCYTRALELNPADCNAWALKGFLLASLRRFEEAVECYDHSLALDPNHASALSIKGWALNELGRFEEVLICTEKSLLIAPLYTDTWRIRGIALSELNRHEEAVDCFKRALETNPQEVNSLSRMGLSLIALGRHLESIDCFEKILEVNPRLSFAWKNKGKALRSLGKYEEAITCIDKALEIDPADEDAWCEKGNELNSLGQYEDALSCFDKALEINPNYAEAWNSKGLALGKLGRYQEALECYDRASAIKS